MWLSRHAEAAPPGAGHLGGLRPRGGEPGWVEAPQRQPDPGPPVGAGEAQPPAGCEEALNMVFPPLPTEQKEKTE